MESLHPCIVMCFTMHTNPICSFVVTLLYYLAELMLHICKEDDVLSTDKVASP